MAIDKSKLPPIYIEGYFSDRYAAGGRPKYGYPRSSLPKVDDKPMEMVTSFMASRQTWEKK
ncbi:hypothetical protein A2671_02540 [Candidatus Kaiserbacteria bacterium RIFCSPHIGHO2_01_FULL_49_13]|uniref:Uncharacterized protein n=1 Tax=Candidatus Kaiserbacteria bacterium RIFCSPHIGHO2_01_FULL_49_13 TaxID=1798477 RepID=A0A1F6CDI7_9BACT|nr:MAG: hypothetical protein A2671_02540 [Candidatus Kaiserbacteria bacterium RIFCSPHIGHO2_01_FULL_49_13]